MDTTNYEMINSAARWFVYKFGDQSGINEVFIRDVTGKYVKVYSTTLRMNPNMSDPEDRYCVVIHGEYVKTILGSSSRSTILGSSSRSEVDGMPLTVVISELDAPWIRHQHTSVFGLIGCSYVRRFSIPIVQKSL